MLEYISIFGYWQGEQELEEGGIVLIWMSMHTFLRYLDATLKGQGYQELMPEQREATFMQCRQCSYWRELAKTIRDPEVHMRRLGGMHPGDYHGE